MTRPLLELRNVDKVYGRSSGLFRRERGGTYAVEGVNLSVKRGETLALVGESGCGKSTTARLALRLIDTSGGDVLFDGREVTNESGTSLRSLRERMQMVFQDPFASLDPRMPVRKIIAEPLEVHSVKGDHRARVDELMSLVGLRADHADRFAHEFSGGQRQRIGIARALALNPELLICDEPVSALDVSIQAQVINLLMDLRQRLGLSYLFISHDLSVVRHIADRVAVMHLGRVIEIGTKQQIFSTPMHPYTRTLLSTVPQPDPARRGRAVRIPPALNVTKGREGCLYQSRCPLASDLCASERPHARSFGDGHLAACHHAESLEPFTLVQGDAVLTPGARRRFDLYVRKRAERSVA
ncbi:ABC transporter ATP-binding protein [Hoeflea alexandrii]|uniref:ABC transporter ATP-binding protein n=1 Tax=Hoeflea alexandrii TaxID=288436 RepID=UPI0022AEA86E|nr:oligopeptide/dipeptide ABC transporter ATP-binding protein [Hoeflea alexandrii]MCZ4291983.1 ATP-binding cassette domain-containing protein [Hoeflea alexandrii]